MLSAAQIDRVASHGHRRSTRAGEVLLEPGNPASPFFVVLAGSIEILRETRDGETLVTRHQAGEFTGEVSILSGRPGLVRYRVGEAGEIVELARDHLLALVQGDSELSEIFMRAFILRRIELFEHEAGDVTVIGSLHSPGTLRVKEFLTRNGHPHTFLDLDRESGVQDLLDGFHVGIEDIPVVICRCETVLRNPSNAQIADLLGFNVSIDAAQLRDLVVIGAGPAGLAAAVYGASEGLDTLVIEATAPGGQAGSSSRIENYLGFPTGVSGQILAARAYDQTQKFGAQVMVARNASSLQCDKRPYAIALADGTQIHGRTVVIATGAEYRRLPLANLARFEGCGVYYSATFMEAQLCKGDDVIVVGGGNSAGQAAVFLSGLARRVHILVRGAGLKDTMSRYLIRRIEDSPNIELHRFTELTGLEGADRLESVRWRSPDGEERQPIKHVFLMTGALPCTAWLKGCVAVDDQGFVRTGPDLTPDDLARARWPLKRSPYLLETSLPGVFAVGDVRGGNVKRVASAVGEGSIAISFVHRVLAE